MRSCACSSPVERLSYKEEVEGSTPSTRTQGRVAQWLERYTDIVEVTGSNPVAPTTLSVAIGSLSKSTKIWLQKLKLLIKHN